MSSEDNEPVFQAEIPFYSYFCYVPPVMHLMFLLPHMLTFATSCVLGSSVLRSSLPCVRVFTKRFYGSLECVFEALLIASLGSFTVLLLTTKDEFRQTMAWHMDYVFCQSNTGSVES